MVIIVIGPKGVGRQATLIRWFAFYIYTTAMLQTHIHKCSKKEYKE